MTKLAEKRTFKEAKLGFCIICGEGVKKQSSYLTTKDGYCHRKCLH